ncbi:CRISPR-associated helicase Cas3' [Saccharothrix violaceirubra]|uniref:CRISPR-associated helicase Cas3/CRISPR-associated endonuclease Cas3-HD n=1 Tax=Saccharothrix violaceirubra TaxID=413306 RepID=A0A7W7T2P9_9PSEU|nr:CRISPR-associated helicase Cas3' [Saccharothrix violaceirubra]MBB4965141.1 CRISPR-associated helicase Cas3/CRISPR-associated endonuclease Cas3-HD [Saccharothrix violaceirubra]
MPVDLRWVWAKSVMDDHGRPTHWLPLQQHLDDAAGVAARLVDHWVSPQVLGRIAKDLGGDVDAVRELACWLARVHDVAKASCAFAVQVPLLADRMRDAGIVANPMLMTHPDRSRAHHTVVGYLAVRDFLAAEVGPVFADQMASVVAAHHGVPPERSTLAEVAGLTELIGGGVWQEAREFFLRRASEGVDWSRYQDIRLSMPSQVLLTAIVILADWIASNADYFPLLEAHEPPRDLDTAARVDHAWKRLALPRRWRASPVSSNVDAAFSERFAIPGGVVRPVQAAAVEVAATQSVPGLVIVEAPMGVGKTEAALLAAEELAARSGADGVFMALPTQATTDAMFDRVRSWVEALPGRDGSVSVTLAHGKASLNDTFTGLVRDGWFTSVGEDGEHDESAVVAHRWLSGRKKGVLASFVVGTIDQVLFAGLKSRHLMLRHLALAGKVVVIDEVHAYDVYMSQYLERVLHWLGAYGVPVVLLSATLPAARRVRLVAAYDGTPAPAVDGYPLILASGGTAPKVLPLPGNGTTVALDRLSDDIEQVVTFLREHLREGGCAVVVRNTVGRVQATAERLEQEFGVEHVTVNHSQFLSCDRARIDRELLRRFGREGERPALHIVVASQVVEQSLDVDFDLMVTDLAPMDLVLQRLGRLHRHPRKRPEPVTTARCAVVGVEDWAAEPVRAVAGSRAVYGEHLLLRSVALIVERDKVALPQDIAPLVQRAYDEDPVGPESWQSALARAKKRADDDEVRRVAAARTFLLDKVGSSRKSLIGWVRAGVGDADDGREGLAQVRDGGESLEVLVVQQDRHGGLHTPQWIDRGGGDPVPTDLPIEPPQERVVAACSLRLPRALSNPGVDLAVISALEKNCFPSFHSSPLLKGQLVLVLDVNGEADIGHGDVGFHVRYDPRRGLVHERR